jgi:2-keto-4-pentenoate hydratase/2-oxohepta-3-ene-1,7-dioic acid hydratase in catechol pathway
MRIARLAIDGEPTFVVSGLDGGWIPLEQLGIEADTTSGLIERLLASPVSERDLETAGERAVTAEEAELRCPIVAPRNVLAIGRNYLDHVKETGSQAPDAPLVFAKLASSLTGPFDDVVLDDRLTQSLDYEVELAVVIGRRAKDVDVAEAMDHVFGFAVANDITARDLQHGDGQWTRGKGLDGFGPIGPWITTADEIDDPGQLELTAHVDGELRQQAPVSDMIFPIDRIIAHLSVGITLEPGDVVLTGTPSGVGMGMEPPTFLSAGSSVRCEITSLGSITNRIVGRA